jgi:aminoglycoside phosphotransferase (APT) family kinase protein
LRPTFAAVYISRVPIPAQRDPERTSRQLEGWLAERLPRAKGIAVSNLSPPASTGFSNDTLLFDLTWEEGGVEHREGLVARIRPSGYQVFPEYDIEQQYRVMKILGEHTAVPVPKAFWYEGDERVLGAPFYVMARIDGRIPPDNPPYHAAGWVTEIDAAERAALWWDGLEVLARIHSLDWRRLGFDFLDRPALGPIGFAQQLAYYERYLAWAARGRPQPIAEAALAWIKRHQPHDQPVGLCWGDARIGNMIFRAGRCMAVLDWEMVALGNPEQDLGWWLFLDRHHSEGLGLPRLEGFPDHAETVARYEQLTGRPVRHLEFYQVWAGFRFAVIMCKLAQGLIEWEVLPPDSDMETNNIPTQMLARMLALPPPGEPTQW